LSHDEYRESVDIDFLISDKSIARDLKKAIETLKKRPGRLNECMVSLKMGPIPEAVLWKKIRDLI